MRKEVKIFFFHLDE